MHLMQIQAKLLINKKNAEQKDVIADQADSLTTLEAENEQRRELAETKKGLDNLKAAVDKLLASKG